MSFVRQYSDHEREQSVDLFLELIEHGFSITHAGNRVRERFGVSRQRVREWAEEMGHEVVPSFARLQQLQSEIFALGKELEWERENGEKLERENDELRQALSGAANAQ